MFNSIDLHLKVSRRPFGIKENENGGGQYAELVSYLGRNGAFRDEVQKSQVQEGRVENVGWLLTYYSCSGTILEFNDYGGNQELKSNS
jgi:hypothetical protein